MNIFKKYIKIISSKKIFKETFWSFMMKGVAFIFFISLNIFLARYLGPKDFGSISYFLSIVNILFLISCFGINNSTNKFVAQYNKTDNLKAVLKSSLKLRIFLSLLFCCFLLFIYKPLANIFERPDFEILFLLSIPFIFFSSIVEYFNSVFQGLHRLKYSFFIVFSEHSLKLIFSILFLLFADGLIMLVYSFNLSLFLAMLIGIYLFYIFFNKTGSISFINKSFGKDILKYSLPLFFVNIGFVVAAEIDTVMLGMLSSDSEVGIYAVAKQIVTKLPHIAIAISLGVMPLFAKLNKENKESLKKLFYKILKINSIIFGIICLIILTTSWFFIPVVFGVEYIKSVAPLMILVPYLIFFSYSVFLSSFLDYQGKAKKRAINISISLVLNILLNFIFIPKYGAIGASMATSISCIPYVLLNYFEVKKFLNNNT